MNWLYLGLSFHYNKKDFVVNFIEILNDFFIGNSFKKKGKSWYLENARIFIICEFQKSAYSNGFFLNFGVVFKGLYQANKIPIRSYDWHFGSRYNKLLGKPDAVFSYEISVSFFASEILTNIQTIILPLLKQVSDISFLQKNFPENFPHEKILLQNIKDSDFMFFVNNNFTN